MTKHFHDFEHVQGVTEDEAPFVEEVTPLDDYGDSYGRNDCLVYSDEVLAQNFIDNHLSELRYTASWGRWFLWDGYRWSADEKLETFSRIRSHCYGNARQAESKEAICALARGYGVSEIVSD